MNIQELSVGDWIKTNDEDSRGSRECTIQNIEKWRNNYVLVVKFKDGSINTLGINCFEPIPLTAEILEKNGLRSLLSAHHTADNIFADVYKDGVAKVEIYSIDGMALLARIIVKYVHQLQHALRLAGVEKDIVL